MLSGGVAVVLPAYHEEHTLAETTNDFLATLSASGGEHCVVIVNDGSTDRTGLVAESLRKAHPGRVRVVHHAVNKGYGVAIRTGIATALKQPTVGHVLLTHADGQFKADELPEFLHEARAARADAVIGYRSERVDPVRARIRGWCRSKLSRLLLGTRSHDVECGYKLIDRRVLRDLDLQADDGVSQAELLVKMRTQGAHIIERPVRHYPRPTTGEATGRSRHTRGFARSLVRLRVARGRGQRASRRLAAGYDPVLRVVTAGAIVSSIAAYVYYGAHHHLLDYPDAVSRLLIARRVVAGSPPGLTQLGGVWLPLPFVLSITLVWNTAIYHNGLAGSAVSMLAYVIATRYVYRIGLHLTRTRLAAAIGAAVFALNVNVLYMQATPMSELVLLACLAAATYHLACWQASRRYQDLTKTSVAVLLATLTRYEGWVLLVAVAMVVVYTTLRRTRSWIRIQSDLLFFLMVGASGVVAWLVWNAVIFHDPLYFKYGPFARSELFVPAGDKVGGNWALSFHAFASAVIGDIGAITLLIAGAGICIHLYRSRTGPESLAPLVSLAFLPFFVFGIHSGQLPLHVTEISGNLYNTRFGLVMVVAAAIFVAVVIGAIQQLHAGKVIRGVLAVAATGAALSLPFLGGVTTLAEAQSFRANPTEVANAAASRWLRNNYDRGRVLMESFGNETVTFDSQLPSQEIIYEGSSTRWKNSLVDPVANGIRWIYMRSTPGQEDAVWKRLHDGDALSQYQLKYQDGDRLIYELASYGDSSP